MRPRRSRRFAGAEDEPGPQARPDNPGHSPRGSTLREAVRHIRQAGDILDRAARATSAAHWGLEIDRLQALAQELEQEILTDAELLEAEAE